MRRYQPYTDRPAEQIKRSRYNTILDAISSYNIADAITMLQNEKKIMGFSSDELLWKLAQLFLTGDFTYEEVTELVEAVYKADLSLIWLECNEGKPSPVASYIPGDGYEVFVEVLRFLVDKLSSEHELKQDFYDRFFGTVAIAG